MNHSLSAIERANPPPRRKSCVACIKAKRRCDLGQPACLRCAQRLLECRYASTGPSMVRKGAKRPGHGVTGSAQRQANAASSTSSTNSTSPPVTSGPLETNPAGGTDYYNIFSGQFVADSTFNTGLDFLDTDLDNCDFLDDIPTEGVGTAVQPECNGVFDIPPHSETRLVYQEKSWPEIAAVEARWASTPIPVTVAQRLQYSLDLIKGIPSQMVTDIETPWCHPALYREEMPRSMQDAIASCALYLAKNDRNSFVILHSITARVKDLTASPASPRPIEVLARVQSLLLYIIMLIFDGDVRARAAAEAAVPALESAAIGLVGLFGHNPLTEDSATAGREKKPAPPESLPLYPIGPARQFWQTWVLQESARRTYMTVFYVCQLYLLLRGDAPKKCDPRLYLCHFWTVSAHLWRAGDAFDFAVAWRDRKHFIVNNSSLKEVLEDAREDDIEDYGKMILTTLMGIDEFKGWLHSRGRSL